MIDGAWLVLRAAGLMLTLQAAGGALFSALFARWLVRSPSAIRRVQLRVAVAALAVLVAQALFEPLHLAGDFSGFADEALLRLFLSSASAAALAVRFAGVACAALALRRSTPQLALLGALLTVSSFLLSGHTSTHPERWLLAPLLLVHLLVVAYWFGSLWPLRQLTALEARSDAVLALGAFSRVAVWLVPVIAVAGAAMAALLLPDVAALWAPYGLLLLAKITLFALLMGLAALNKLHLTRQLATGAARAPARLRGSIALEYALVCAALAVTAVMTGSFSPTPT